MKKIIGITLLYCLLFFLFSFPLILQFNSNYFHKEGDGWLFVWNLWWIDKTVMEGTNPLVTDFLFYPVGVDLYFHDFPYFVAFLAIPLMKLFSIVTTFNLISLLSYVLAALGAYFLVSYLTKNSYAGFIAGIIYGFSPFHMSNYGSLNLVSIEWIPFFLLFFLKLWEEWQWKYVFLSSLFLWLIALSSWYYLVFMIFFFLFFFIYHLIYNRKIFSNYDHWKKIIVMFLLFILFILPFALPMVLTYKNASNQVDIIAYVAYSVDVVGFVIPSYLHPLFSSGVEKFYTGPLKGGIFTGRWDVAYLGIIPLILLFYAIYHYRFKVRFWAFFFLFSVVLSLGPALHFYGLVTIPISLNLDKIFLAFEPNLLEIGASMLENNIGIPLPYILVYFTPFLQMARAPSRLLVFVTLALSILAGFGVKKVLEKHVKPVFIFLLIILILLLEFASVPFALPSQSFPSFYSLLAEEKEDFAIVQLPHDYSSHLLYMYYQTIHEKKMLGGASSRGPPNELLLIPENYSLSWMMNPVKDIEEKRMVEELSTIHKKYNFKYLILHKKLMDISALESTLLNNLDMYYQDTEVLVFSLP